MTLSPARGHLHSRFHTTLVLSDASLRSWAGYVGWKGVPRPIGSESCSMRRASVVSMLVDIGLMADDAGAHCFRSLCHASPLCWVYRVNGSAVAVVQIFRLQVSRLVLCLPTSRAFGSCPKPWRVECRRYVSVPPLYYRLQPIYRAQQSSRRLGLADADNEVSLSPR